MCELLSFILGQHCLKCFWIGRRRRGRSAPASERKKTIRNVLNLLYVKGGVYVIPNKKEALIGGGRVRSNVPNMDIPLFRSRN